MKNKLLIIILLLLAVREGNAQTPGRNTEKYWWYRYRLVNDFMKIGDKCGESIPASQRWQIDSNDLESEWSGLHWGDATQHLGNYINMLAGEQAMLRINGMSVERTNMELYYALNAFERLDKNAEEYCEDIDATYPCKAQGKWKTGARNGFFIRDDVPYYNYDPYGYKSFLNLNLKHFNRPGIISTIPVNNIRESDFAKRVNVPGYFLYTPVSLRRMPVEESHDQIVQLFGGMGMATRLLDNSAYYNGEYLANKAGRNLFNMINYIPYGNTIFQTLQWYIRNPTTGSRVVGIGEGGLGQGGELFTFYSNGAVPALRQTANGRGVSLSEINDLGHLSHAPGYAEMWQLMQNVGPGFMFRWQGKDIRFKDGVYADTYAAFANDWIIGRKVLGITIGRNKTWDKLKTHALKEQFCRPTIPLMFRIVSGPGTGHGTDFDTKEQPTYAQLLDRSAFCGNFSYQKNSELNPNNQRRWSEWYWSSDSWSQDYDRRGSDNNNGDFNNLDYMMLFNLYNLCDASYLQYYFNCYYLKNLATPFKGLSNSIGSFNQKLTLNYLEYLSLINKHQPNSYVTYRGAKVIELLPGFEAKYGSTVTAYVKDYDCAKDDYHFATVKYKAAGKGLSSDSTEYEVPVEYAPDMVPFHMENIAGTPDWVEPDTTNMPTVEDEQEYTDSLVQAIYNSGDTLLISQYEAIFLQSEQTANKGFNSTLGVSPKILRCTISPIPSSGIFTVVFNQNTTGLLTVSNLMGQIVYRTVLKEEHRKVIGLDAGLPQGNYIVNIQTSAENVLKKVIIIK